MPKAMYKANQAKKRMAKIQAAGKSGIIGVLVNGLSEVDDVEVDREELKLLLGIEDDEVVERVAKAIEKDIKEALNAAKKNLEKELIKNTNLDELKGLLGG